MPYSPVSWAFRELITSAKLAQMQENVVAHDHRDDGLQGAALFASATIWRSAAYSLPDNGATRLPFDTNSTGNTLSTQLGATAGIVIPSTGRYLVEGRFAALASSPAGPKRVTVGVFRNGTTEVIRGTDIGNEQPLTILGTMVCGVRRFTANDVLSLHGYSFSGGALPIETGEFLFYFSVTRLGR